MWLLNVHSRELEDYIGDRIPPYATLSHTWSDSEVIFRDLAKPDHATKPAYAKIEGCCQQAIRDGHDYVWIDTCCIDKSSSAELSEAINSMYQWYKGSEVCYVHLSDVSASDDPFREDSEFRRSRWFTRGWTLQELIAPRDVCFFDKNWDDLHLSKATSPSGLDLLSKITGIPPRAIAGDLDPFCAAARLGWAAERKTTRVEDVAYSLLGLLDVNMPLIYGEGRKAFRRLQENILKTRDDDSILAAGYGLPNDKLVSSPPRPNPPVLADSPSAFRHCRDITTRHLDRYSVESYLGLVTAHSTWTNIGLQISLPMISLDRANGVGLAILRYSPNGNERIAIPLVAVPDSDAQGHFERLSGANPFPISITALAGARNRKNFTYLSPYSKHSVNQIYLRDPPSDFHIPVRKGRRWWLRRERYLVVDYADVIRGAGYVPASFYPPPLNTSYSIAECTFSSTQLRWALLLFRKPSHAFIVGIQFPYVAGITKPFAFGIAEVDEATTLEYVLKRTIAAKLPKDMPIPEKHVLEFEEVAVDGSTRVKRRISLNGLQSGPEYPQWKLFVRYEYNGATSEFSASSTSVSYGPKSLH
ncbi:hypothetical protein DL764_008756 [Monosporascus ibericus]|uniref:Uncharacterized protein n=1 Tax=Monosporascus ibericus TaxID=155417 RepID=A0A4Q4SWQ7_9PEZI|nr:hypothetical protein DL764_008756 [Monosporascus ibericus]